MKFHEWSLEKNEKLKKERGVSFEEIIIIIKENRHLDQIENPNTKKYPGQKIYILEINNYVYLVPYVETTEKVFLKTIIPSRKLTKKYLK